VKTEILTKKKLRDGWLRVRGVVGERVVEFDVPTGTVEEMPKDKEQVFIERSLQRMAEQPEGKRWDRP
jgi:hypothetical protein